MTTFLIQVIHLITSLEGSPSGLGWGKHSCFTPKRQNSKEIEVDISIFLSYSVLCWHIVKYSCDFVPVSIFNFVLESYRVLCCFLPNTYDTPCLARWARWEWTFYASKNAHIQFSYQAHLCAHKSFILKTGSWLLQFYTAMVHLKMGKRNRVCFNLALRWS